MGEYLEGVGGMEEEYPQATLYQQSPSVAAKKTACSVVIPIAKDR